MANEMLTKLLANCEEQLNTQKNENMCQINRIYVRGDVHGNFDWVKDFCKRENTTTNDLMILAGDSGLLFFGKEKLRENILKNICASAPITFLVVRGNHDNRPENEGMVLRHNDFIHGDCYWEDERPNILYAKDGGLYWMKYKFFLTIGGAYSVDKFYRLRQHWTWYPDEELTDEEMEKILFSTMGNEIDYIISHTCPLDMEPTWLFMKNIDQTTVSKRMEKFLQRIKNTTMYSCWIWGHYHDDHVWPRLDQNAKLTPDDPLHMMLIKDIVMVEGPDYSILDHNEPMYVI